MTDLERPPVLDVSVQRALALLAAVACGVLLAERLRPRPGWSIAAALIAAALALRRPSARTMLGLAMCFGVCLAGLRLASLDGAALRHGASRSADVLLEGDLLGDPVIVRDAARVVVGVRVAEVDGRAHRVRERVLLTIRPAPPKPLTGGTTVRADARLRPLAPPDADGDARRMVRSLERRGIAARAFAGPNDVDVVGRSRAPLSVVAEAGRSAVRAAASKLPERYRGLLLGVTIGDTSLLPPEVELDFKITGLAHLVAVSGANVAMVLAVVAACARAARAGPRLTTAIMAVAVLSFMAITRFEPSVMRAGAMASIGLLAATTGARRQATLALAVTALVLAAFDPFILLSLGFQLSALATGGILLLAPRIAERLPQGALWGALAITAGAQLAVAPLLVWRMGEFSLVSLAANLVVAPLVAPATVLGMCAAALGAVWAPLANLALAAAPFIAGMQWLAHVMAELPLASLDLSAGLAPAAVAVCLAVVAVRVARGDRRVAGLLAMAAVIAGTGAVVRGADGIDEDGLVVTMIDVGQGEAIVVRCGGATMLVDGGPDRRTIIRDLREQNVRKVDLLVTTHPHEDHVAGLVSVPERIPIARALDPYIEDDLPNYRAFVHILAGKGVPRDRARAGMRYRVGCATVDVLWPPRDLLEGTEADINNNSVVLRVSHEGRTVLLAGETQEEAQAELLRRPALLRADVLKVSHHGSARMLPEFYRASRARLALIPVGPNTFGHPAPATLAALSGMRVLRSDLHGDVRVGLGEEGVAVSTAR